MTQTRTFIVSESDDIVRIDKYLATQMPEYSRSEIQRFTVTHANGAPVKFSDKIKFGDEYTVEIPEMQSEIAIENVSHDFELDILFEDEDIIVINKPRGVVMYPSAGNKTGTLVQNILAYTHLSALGGDIRPGVVHRLDKDTSGVMVFAKSDRAFRGLVKIFSEHNLTRKYIAFVWGIPNWEVADITGNIARSSRNRQKMAMVKSGGKESHTEVTVINAWSRVGVSQMRCNLFTGRTHQIRLHLSSHGFPVLCDPLYGRGSAKLGTVKDPDLLEFLKTHNGQMLHAEILEFTHPVTGEKMKFRAHMPDDMLELKYILENI